MGGAEGRGRRGGWSRGEGEERWVEQRGGGGEVGGAEGRGRRGGWNGEEGRRYNIKLKH